jgi:hypothetical protein
VTLVGVFAGAEEMQRHIRLISDDPTVVTGRDVKQITGFHLNDAAVVHCGSGAAREDETDVLDLAALLSLRGANVRGPLPSRLIAGTANGHAAEVDEFELAFFEGARFVGMIEALEDDVVHIFEDVSPNPL